MVICHAYIFFGEISVETFSYFVIYFYLFIIEFLLLFLSFLSLFIYFERDRGSVNMGGAEEKEERESHKP